MTFLQVWASGAYGVQRWRQPWGKSSRDVRKNLGAAEWPVLSVPWGKTRRGRDRESR
jgi:hypothetical protein